MPTFERSTPVLKTGDYARAKAFYTQTLGFRVLEEGGDPPRFGIFARDGARVFLDGWKGAPTPTANAWDAYFHVDDVDGVAADLAAKGIKLARPPHDTAYGMRECELLDPDGNRLCFGQ